MKNWSLKVDHPLDPRPGSTDLQRWSFKGDQRQDNHRLVIETSIPNIGKSSSTMENLENFSGF